MKVVTWNIRAAIGPGPFPDRWCDLARQLGMEIQFGAVRTFHVMDGDAVTGAGCFGNALLSRRPIRVTRTIGLPVAPAEAMVEPEATDHPAAGTRYADAPATIREPRCLLLAELDDLTVGSTHFSHIGFGERLLQAQATHDAFEEASPALLLGDLNAPIEAPELAPLAGWTDGFEPPPGDPGRISTDDGWLIDQVLARGASVHGCRVLRESGDLSDHYPVVADISVKA